MSNTFSKLRLVRDEELSDLKQKRIRNYDPKIRTLMFLQSEMDSILNSGLAPEEMHNLFITAQSRYESFKRNTQDTRPPDPPRPQTPQLFAAREENEEEFVDATDSPEDEDLIALVPKPSRAKAREVLKQINDNPDFITFDGRKQLHLHNQPLQGSNFHDLFLALFNPSSKRTEYPHGEIPFHSALRDLNVATSLIPNKNYRSMVTGIGSLPSPPHLGVSASSSSTSLAEPKHRSRDSSLSRMQTRGFSSLSHTPGTAPEILRAYPSSSKTNK
jgi:hypothetical protein